MKVIDISLTIHPQMVIFPGDPRPKFSKWEIPDENNSFTTSWLEFLSHTGTHIDAPSHLIENSLSVDRVDLNRLVGEAIVIDVSSTAKMNVKNIKKSGPFKDKIVILKTEQGENLERGIFKKGYLAPNREIAEFLVEQKIKSIGIDTLSIDSFDISEVESHPVFLQANIPIIEGLNLTDVPPGQYFFVCLPLKLQGIDGAPSRAILIKF